MQNHFERRTGTDRRAMKLSSTTSIGQESLWNETSGGGMFGDGDHTYDPFDPYWEPLKGQDDD